MIRKSTETGRVVKLSEVALMYRAACNRKLARPLVSANVPVGFPSDPLSPVEQYAEGRIDLNKEFIKHPLATFYVRASGDSMIGAGIYPGTLLIVDRAEEAREGHIVIARIADQLCVKRFSCSDDGRIWLLSDNHFYDPIEIKYDCDFEVWGRVMHVISSF